jgi:3-hydroxybutyryl-CoA dehydrogenase
VSVSRVLVAGAGQMGAGIVQVVAQSGLDVVMTDVADEFVERGMNGITKRFARLVEKGKIDAAARDAALGRIVAGTDLGLGKDADLFIEAAPETLAIKRELLGAVSAMLKPEAIIATNTSSLSVTALAAFTDRPERFVGVHFFNPVPVMALVEVVRGGETSDATVATARGFAESLGKTPITVTDSPGFVVNRILFPMINEAVWALSEGVSSAEEIDVGMKLGANLPMGPLALADLVGLDTTKAILETLARDLGDTRYQPCPLFDEHVAAGRLGRKSGAGFYTYG